MAKQQWFDRVTMNRAWADKLDLAMADALFALAKEIVTDANPPVYEGYLEIQGGAAAWVKGATGNARKVAEFGLGADQTIKKPRAVRIKPGVTAIGGFGQPGRWVESGTANMRAQPFLTPVLMSRIGDAAGFIRLAAIKHKLLGESRAAAGDTFQAGKARSLAKAAAKATP